MLNPQPSIFLGLVTYPGTRYPESSTENGLLQKLATELSLLGNDPTVGIQDHNLATEQGLTFTQQDVRESIHAELDTESRWRAYLNPQSNKLGIKLFMALRTVYRKIKNRNGKGQRMLLRLANIELAHLYLLQQALNTNSDWALIVEDDAKLNTPADLAKNLLNFIETQEPQEKPKYVNLSKSFSDSYLKTRGLLSPVARWNQGGEEPTRVYSSKKPFTNTVCAILYRRDFLVDLMDQFNQIPVKPVLPIDWKLNKAIMTMVERQQLGEGDFWLVEPGPIVQGSMFNS